MGDTKIYRFRKFTIKPDPMGLPTYEATCVSGDEVECGEQSGETGSAADRDIWIQAHFKSTGHRRFHHTAADYRIVEPGEWQ
ncbi:hypothetical protein ABUW04_16080 [Streptacidiphilus sp. N1-10]|uniref:DUF7848 domain-containing protein n=1 Tax=Streptacidiphilus jeojiensis TaxID=3229225 RepID=A0ABV6XND2_9ACTN